MRALFVLLAFVVGMNGFAATKAAPGYRIHIWACSSVVKGSDHGYSVSVDNVYGQGVVVKVSTQSIVGPQVLGQWVVSESGSVPARPYYEYLDQTTAGKSLKLTITDTGKGKFIAIPKKGGRHAGQLTCYRTRSL